ncbi:DUF1190 domain-containing protein [Caulobacter segnis]|uniref:Cell surface protein n=1 Tax=Caulobacter segnis TaxID=88688 RepID=A0A2W5VK49_9CAUL|nr:DUF1190 domain-containing protein [Caulobacter segnis]PZR35695.1 MAG: cell surface protein [Caulobacter segnis]
MSPRKRSASLQLTTMLAGAASLTLAGCDDPSPGAQAGWDPNRGEQVEAFSYKSLEECKAANEVSDQQCDTSWAAAQKDDAKNAPRYEARASCEDVYGAGNCVPRSEAGGGSFFTPLLAGFVIGRMLDGGDYYRGTGLYRRNDDYGGGYYSTWGGRLGRDYGTGRTVITRESIDPPDAIRNAPPKVQTRTSVVSRGGFGGGRSYAHSGGFKGGFGG